MSNRKVTELGYNFNPDSPQRTALIEQIVSTPNIFGGKVDITLKLFNEKGK